MFRRVFVCFNCGKRFAPITTLAEPGGGCGAEVVASSLEPSPNRTGEERQTPPPRPVRNLQRAHGVRVCWPREFDPLARN